MVSTSCCVRAMRPCYPLRLANERSESCSLTRDVLASGATDGGGSNHRRPLSMRTGVVSVLYTSDRRVFSEHDNSTIRVAFDWVNDEGLTQRQIGSHRKC